MSFILSTAHLKYGLESVTLDHIICQVRLEVRFQQWRQAFGQICAEQRQRWNQHERRAAKIISAQNISMQIWISTCLSPEESIFDRFKPQFEKIIDLATEVIGPGGQELRHLIGNFQFDMGLIPPLHFIGSKCRWPLLRRKVLRILGCTHWREGLYDSYRSYRCLHLLMTTGEVGLRRDLEPGSADFNEFARLLPPEPLRIHLGELEPPPLQADEQMITLVMKPNDVFNPPVILKTSIPTSGDLPLLEPWYMWSP